MTHSSTYQMEHAILYVELFRKWYEQCSGFMSYFENQWNTGMAFSQWKVFCCAPCVATTKVALESSNADYIPTQVKH